MVQSLLLLLKWLFAPFSLSHFHESPFKLSWELAVLVLLRWRCPDYCDAERLCELPTGCLESCNAPLMSGSATCTSSDFRFAFQIFQGSPRIMIFRKPKTKWWKITVAVCRSHLQSLFMVRLQHRGERGDSCDRCKSWDQVEPRVVHRFFDSQSEGHLPMVFPRKPNRCLALENPTGATERRMNINVFFVTKENTQLNSLTMMQLNKQ